MAIDYRSKPDVDEVQDVDLRKAVFREMARDFVLCMREGAVTDRAGAIAKMMESAFRAGMEVARNDLSASPKDRFVRRMTDMDLPSHSRKQMSRLRLSLFGGDVPAKAYREPKGHQLIMLKRPAIPGLPSTMTRDEWLMPGYPKHRDGLSNRIIKPMIDLGLMTRGELSGGWSYATVSEWGFELLATGETSQVPDRVLGASSTYERYLGLIDVEEDLLISAARALGVLANDPAPGPGR